MILGDIPMLMGPFLLLHVAVVGLSVIGAFAMTVRLGRRTSTPVVVLVLPILVPALVVVASAVAGLSYTAAGEPSFGMAVNLGTRLMGWVYLWPSAFLVGLGACVASIRAPERRWGSAGLLLAIGLATAVVPWAYGIPGNDYIPVGIRSAVYAVGAVMMALAALGRSDSGDKADAALDAEPAAAAGIAFAVIVGGGEMFQTGLARIAMLHTLSRLEESSVQTFYESVTPFIEAFSPWNHVTVALAMVAAWTALLLAAQHGRRLRIGLAACTVLVVPMLAYLGDPTVEAFRAMVRVAG